MGCIEKRYLITLLSCLGFAFIMLLQILSEMREWQWIYLSDGNYDFSAKSITKLIFVVGQMTSLFGGIISNRYGGVVTFGVAMLLCAGINLLFEFILRISLVLFMVAKLFHGAIQGVMYSSIADIWSRWTTLKHRSKYVSFTLAGYQLAEMIQVMFFPWENNPLEFVAIGAAFWAIIWLLLVKNDPSQDENLSNAEKIILQERLKFLNEESVALRQYPWLPILTSKSFWALNGAALVNGSSYFFTNQMILEIFFPRYMREYPMSLVTSLSMFIITMISGCIVDYIRNKDIVTNNKVKLFVCVSFVTQSMIPIAFYLSHGVLTVMLQLYALSLICRTYAAISIQTIVIDSSPRYASLLNGIQYSFYMFGILCPHALIVFMEDWLQSHNLLPLFIAIPALNFISGSLYYIFGSTKLQSWNGISKDGQELEEHKNRTIVVE